MVFPNLLFYNDWGLLALRLAVAVVFVVHGWPKLKKYKEMSAGMGLPAWFVRAQGLVESLGGLAMALGFLAQLVAIAFAAIMVGAIYFKAVKWNMKFMMDGATGWELDTVLLAANLAILLSGGGNLGLL